IFHRDAPPNMRFRRDGLQRPGKQLAQTSRPFREDLVCMPARQVHRRNDSPNIRKWNLLVKQIAHGVDEDHSRLAPSERFRQFLRNKSQVESLFERMSCYAPKSLSEAFSVAVLTARTDLRAATNRIPRRISPFDLGKKRHRAGPRPASEPADSVFEERAQPV